jgi:hypothetical protein
MDAYIDQYGENDEKCENAVFDAFAAFFEANDFGELKKPQRQPFIRPLLMKVGTDLEQTFPELLRVLLQKYVFSLDFLRIDLSRWFVDVFGIDDVKVLWLSVLTFNNVPEFFECFVIALLFMVVTETSRLSALTFEEFIEQFNEVKPKCNIRSLLVSAKEYHEKLHPK